MSHKQRAIRIILLSAFFCTLLVPVSYADAKRVLILNSYHEGYHWTDKIMSGVKSVFNKEIDVELFISYMDTKRSSDSKYFEQLSDLYAHKYRFLKFDVIVSSDDNALNFLLKYRDKLFPNVPVIFCGINDFQPSRIANHSLFSGVYESYDVSGTVNLMLRLHPKTESIFIITDSTHSGNDFRRLAQRAEPIFANKVQFKYLTNLGREELSLTLKKLPPQSLVLWAIYLRTPEGVSISSEESVGLVTTSSGLPTYTIWDVVGQGVVGGKITNPVFQGEMAAEMALKILHGSHIKDLPVTGSPSVYLFDYSVIKKFKIDLSVLPENSTFLNRPESFYDKYRKQIWVVITIFTFLCTLVILLIINILYRIRSENKIKKLQQKLLFYIENTPLAVIEWSPNFEVTSWNRSAELIFGYSATEVINRHAMDLIVPSTTKKEQQEVIELLKLGQGGTFSTNENNTKDGRIIHCEWYNTPLVDNKNKVFGVASLVLDISDRKQAEEQLKASLKEKNTLIDEIHHRVKNNMNVVLSLLKLQANNIEDNQIKEILKESQNRVYAMSAVHEMLHGSEDLSKIYLTTYLSKITTNIFQTYSVNTDKVKLNSTIEKAQIGLNQAYPLGLIISELISNSLKYAFPKDKQGEVNVSMKKLNQELHLTVMDDGVGMPDGFDWKNSNTLGLKLVRTLVENQLDGSLNVESNNGTKFTIKFDIEN